MLRFSLIALCLASFATAAEPQWFKGNTHAHSLWSDGDDFPEMITDWYVKNGYAFLGLSDHNTLARGERWLLEEAVEKKRKGIGRKVLDKYRDRFGADWVQTRMAAVEDQGEGRIGYLHLRAMGGNDIASFVRDFYANVERDGLIIDVRRNRGGNIDSWVIEKLLRRTWAFWQSPGRTPSWNMQQSFRGHLVVLTDALTYSDGETFAAGVKALGLGPVVGTRTSGAGIWLSDRNRLADGGSARIAEFGQFGADGRWLIEGRGVSPDVEVDNLPHESYKGRDRQLETAIAMLEKALLERPIVQPPAQRIPPPDQPGQDAVRIQP